MAALLAALLASPGLGQSTTVIEGGQVITGDGRVIEQGNVVIRGEKIAAVGRDAQGSGGFLGFGGPTKIDARGKYVTPGLIDPWSTLGARVGGGEARAIGMAADAVDTFARDELTDALRQGVTTVYVPARAGQGIGGIGAVVRLWPGGAREDVVLAERAGLSATLIASGPIGRVRLAEAMLKELQAAREYREALETYEDEVKEYEEKLKKWAEEQARKRAEGKPEEPSGKGEAGKSESKVESKPSRDSRRGGARGQAKPDAKADEKKEEDGRPKKPAKPERDADKEALLEAIDGQLVLRVEAYRAADVLNALEVAERFNLALIVEGATGARHVAALLAEREVPVVLDAAQPTVAYAGGLQRDRSADALKALLDAGAPVYLGTGGHAGLATPGLALRAAHAVGQGWPEAEVWQAITSRAAELLGVGERVGRLEAGMEADVVIWSDHPFAPGARAERVFLAGREVYRADGEEAQ